MIHLLDVTKRYGPQTLFEGLSWTVVPGERVALVGPNGSGKSTLCQIIAGLEPVDAGEISRPRDMRLGYLRQEVDPTSQQSVLERALGAFSDVRAMQAEVEDLHRRLAGAHEAADHSALLARMGELQARLEQVGGYAIEAEAERVLCGLGFTPAQLQRPVSEFSGGWLMRIELARLLLGRPEVLILDEPTNHLDIPALEWFEGFLGDFRGTLIVVSHDRFFLNRVANRVAALEHGRLTVHVGNYDAWLVAREVEKELLLKRKKGQDRQIKQTERFIERFRYKASKAKAVQSRVKALEKVDRIEIEADARGLSRFTFPQPVRTGREVMRLVEVVKRYGDVTVYDGLDFRVERGMRLALVGPNGAGKSTLLKILAGVEAIQGGERIPGTNVSIHYFGQHQLEQLNPGHTVYEAMVQGAEPDVIPGIRGMLGAFLFSGGSVDKKVGVLSGGEKGRLALARMMLAPASFLLLDEPTNHLDMTARDVLQGALAGFEGTICFISHDRHFINGIATHVAEVAHGQVELFEGGYDYYLWKKRAAPALVAEAMPAARAAEAPPEGGDRGISRKERKRLEAELRQVHSRRTREARAQLDVTEGQIAETEARLEAIAASQEDPAFFDDSEAVQRTYAEQASCQKKLEALMESWEALGTELEEADAELKARLAALAGEGDPAAGAGAP